METCPTVRVITDNDDGFMDINESDFDKGKHKLFVPKKVTKKKVAKKK